MCLSATYLQCDRLVALIGRWLPHRGIAILPEKFGSASLRSGMQWLRSGLLCSSTANEIKFKLIIIHHFIFYVCGDGLLLDLEEAVS